MSNWLTISRDETLDKLNSTPKGLTSDEATTRLKKHGLNRIEETGKKNPVKILFQQFTETMVLILIVAAIISALLGKDTEAIAIFAIVLLFGLLGFFQEYRAEKAMAALNRMVVPLVRVRRDEITQEVPAKEIVPGDIVEFEAGNLLPADLRIIEAHNLKVQESALTGESEPVNKTSDKLPNDDVPLGDRKNMAYMGTIVTYGRGVGAVVSTGMNTELGKIASLIKTVKTSKTPLQEKLARLGKLLALFGLFAAGLIFAVGMFLGETLVDMFLTAVSVAVAVVPEGLPAVVTITLALGGQRMLKRHALIRKLPAVETLGSVTVICSDKTGTLTQNKMTVTIVDLPNQTIDFNTEKLSNGEPAHHLDFAMTALVLCNDAILESGEKEGEEKVIGDPTETALLVAGAGRDLFKNDLQESLPRVKEIPFDSDRKRMSTVHAITGKLPDFMPIRENDPYIMFTKGAADSLLTVSDTIFIDNKVVPLDEEWKSRIHNANTQLAEEGIRVLGVAYKMLQEEASDISQEQNLTFIGIVGMIDPPRPEAQRAVAKCKQAGIKTVMITGDHPLTASAIAGSLGILGDNKAIAGDRLQKMSQEELLGVASDTSVYARVSPEDKLRIVNALQSRGEIVAMTGDGVNDSPALKTADIGVAMGITGTDVAKEASDMVLLDDNFATIVEAVEEGRVIFDNLRRFILFSLAGNVGKVLIMLLAPFFGMVVALQPLQLLWLNLMTDGLLGLGLGTEPAEKDTMNRPPRNPEKGALSRTDIPQLATVGIAIGIISLGIAMVYYNPLEPQDTTWQTMIFATVGFAQVFQALALRSSARSAFSVRSNPLLVLLVVITILLQLAVIYLPFLQPFFKLEPLSFVQLLITIGAGSLIFVIIKIERRLRRKKVQAF